MSLSEITKNYNYIIGSGWWCSDQNVTQSGGRKVLGDDFIRTQEFHRLWYQSVIDNTNPKKIIIVDSNSPIRPDLNVGDQRIEFLRLPVNSGYAAHTPHKLSGWTKSVLTGLQYAVMAEADYFVYVEQDVLLKGAGIVEHCIERMSKPFMFGGGDETPQPLQQSFMIFKVSHAQEFINRYMSINCSDRELSPEQKFVLATWWFPSLLTWYSCFFKDRRRRRLLRKFSNFDVLPVGYGRSRPINFDDKFYYFQHGARDEIARYLADSELKIAG